MNCKNRFLGLALVLAGAPLGAAIAQVTVPNFVPGPSALVTGSRANGMVALSDVDGDGLLDCVTSNLTDQTIRVVLQQAGGGFGPTTATVFGSPFLDSDPAWAVGDADRDGRADIIAFGRASPQACLNCPNILMRMGDTLGGFVGQVNLNNQPGSSFPATAIHRGIAFADVNNDGFLDIVSGTTSLNDEGFHVSVMLGDGAGAFGVPIVSGRVGSSLNDFILVGDINGDGHPDVVSMHNAGTDSHAAAAGSVNLGDGAGQFLFVGSLAFDCKFSTSAGNARVFLTDMNGDGRADLVVFGFRGGETGAGGLYVRLSNGNGTFTQSFRLVGSTADSTILVADFNRDGFPDILRLAEHGAPGTEVLLNSGAGTLPTTAPFPVIASGLFEARDAAGAGIFGGVGGGAADVAVLAVDDIAQQVRIFTFRNTTPPACGSSDFNHDGDAGTDADIEAFFACLAGNCCTACGSADFNGDGDTGTDADIEAFFRVLAGGPC
jgi:FG-GAP-like repeat